ncbi:unnamed protein product [Vitrella brassicaformis CCMP3155]|uniref:Uncharacterized protein n=1 Tax=Vitrella brassicaformis (strain CCMP3155) TaxID=1169540 RepID=A0A0G4EK43_VITBC|nr:unnamed protein product [Vitrella brassicaformis CCMP3155]|eukprot:CEL96919.1 unnamed protein product [Vitrella brassicaformis CCMP3155]
MKMRRRQAALDKFAELYGYRYAYNHRGVGYVCGASESAARNRGYSILTHPAGTQTTERAAQPQPQHRRGRHSHRPPVPQRHRRTHQPTAP